MAKKHNANRTLIARVSYAQWLAVKAWSKTDGVNQSIVMRGLIDRETRRRGKASTK